MPGDQCPRATGQSRPAALRRRLADPLPHAYRTPVTERLATLEALGVRAFPALVSPHKADMAAWLSEWAPGLRRGHARLRPERHLLDSEPGVAAYVDAALEAGTRLFKVHLQVGGYDPRADELDPVWGRLAEAGVPVIAHLGMPEYAEHLGQAERYPNVHLDTTMACTPFTEALMPMPPELRPRLAGLQDRIVLGSDFATIPHPYAVQLESLERLDLGDDWLRAVCRHDGARLLRLEP